MSGQDDLIADWTEKQLHIAAKVDQADSNNWAQFFSTGDFSADRDLFVAGADISFSASEQGHDIATLVIVILRKNGGIDLVYSRSQVVTILAPYVPSFLGFREAPIVSKMLSELPPLVRRRIDCLLLDGNGILHPRKAGLACQVGVEENMATIGVSKALLCVDGLDEREMRKKVAATSETPVAVIGESGTTWANALLTGNAQNKPIYVSVGHKVSLQTASKLVQKLCVYRVPAPIRFADLHSRAHLRGEVIDVYKAEEFV